MEISFYIKAKCEKVAMIGIALIMPDHEPKPTCDITIGAGTGVAIATAEVILENDAIDETSEESTSDSQGNGNTSQYMSSSV